MWQIDQSWGELVWDKLDLGQNDLYPNYTCQVTLFTKHYWPMKIDRKIEVYFHCSVMFRNLYLSLSMSSLIENSKPQKSERKHTIILRCEIFRDIQRYNVYQNFKHTDHLVFLVQVSIIGWVGWQLCFCSPHFFWGKNSEKGIFSV